MRDESLQLQNAATLSFERGLITKARKETVNVS